MHCKAYSWVSVLHLFIGEKTEVVGFQKGWLRSLMEQGFERNPTSKSLLFSL